MSEITLLQYYKKGVTEAGCDEAGRGCLAGPVVAAAVVLPPGFKNPFLGDSKKLTKERRLELRIIIENNALAWAVEMVSNDEIDKVNILNASFLAMNRAIQKLKIVPDHLIIDGNRFRSRLNIPYTCIIKGDGLYFSIAAASVLAKTYRDEYMERIHHDFPLYEWNKNKGYATRKHRQAIASYGLTKYHRRSFRLINQQLEIEF